MARPLARQLYLPYTAYAAVALGIVLPWLRPGYILTLDMVFTPHLRMPTTVNNNYLFGVLLHVLNSVVPSQIIQKLLLAATFFLAGASMHYLARGLRASIIGCYAAGVFYAVNPFTYDRLMAGQYLLLLGYALVPLFVRQLMRFLETPRQRQVVWVGAIAAGISIVSLHVAVMLAICTGVAACIWLVRSDATEARRLLGGLTAAAGIFVVLSSYWLLPLALGKGSTATQLAQFSAQDTTAFATIGSNPVEKVANLIRLQGFWAEDRDQYRNPQSVVPAWGLIALVILIVVGLGWVQLWRIGRRHVVFLCSVLMVLGVALAAGLGSGSLAHIGFRESQKFALFVAVGYGIGLGFGVPVVIHGLARRYNRGAVLVATSVSLCLPLAFTPTLLWGAWAQLTPRQYPASWTQANQLLDQQADQRYTIFLPWHLYMWYGWSGRIIAAPAPAFFDTPVIVSDNPEFNGAGRSMTTPIKQQLDHILAAAPKRQDLGLELAQLHVRYIILAREDDYQSYHYLDMQPDLARVFTSDTLDVYRVTTAGGAYAAR
ncbi:MAG TPA: hypothetical protein VJP80_06610 [Candidatus Saccharimonadales bacterium]|nr:hypothetical protein [Candidatus Saccharimonadales bacterium]